MNDLIHENWKSKKKHNQAHFTRNFPISDSIKIWNIGMQIKKFSGPIKFFFNSLKQGGGNMRKLFALAIFFCKTLIIY